MASDHHRRGKSIEKTRCPCGAGWFHQHQYIRELIRLCQSGERALSESDPALLRQIREFAAEIDLPYTLSELDELLPVTRNGLSRIRQIVKDLRDFARHEAVGDVQEGADLNVGIESTVNIAVMWVER